MTSPPVSSAAAAAPPGLRNLSLDLLKVVMAAMVIGLHGGFLRDVNPAAASYFTNGLFRIAVPTFFLINGYYLERLLDRGVWPWFRRMLVLYGLWMLIYGPRWLRPDVRPLEDIAKDAVIGFYHLWYLIALIAAAFLVQLLRWRFGRRSGPLALAAGMTFAAGLSIQYLGNFHLIPNAAVDDWMNTVDSYRNFLFFGFPFLAFGVLIARFEPVISRLSRWYLPLTILGLAALTLEWGLNYHFNRQNSVFEIYLSLALLCPMLFLTVKARTLMGRNRSIGLFATGIYLIHVWVLHLTYHVEMGDTARTLIGLAASAALAPLLVLANRRLPLL